MQRAKISRESDRESDVVDPQRIRDVRAIAVRMTEWRVGLVLDRQGAHARRQAI